jgi:hypothetical protein
MNRSRTLFLAASVLVACAGFGVSCGGAISPDGSDSGTGGSSGSGSGSSSGGGSGSSSGSGGGSGAGSGSGVTSSSSGSGSSSGGGSGGQGVDSGSGSGCGATPLLHPTEAGTIFCALVAANADCTVGQECCVGGGTGNGQFADDECATFGATCTNGGGSEAGTNEQPIPIECNQIADCAANGRPASACCLQGGKSSTVAGCGYPKYSDGTAIVCEGAGGSVAPCAAGEVQVCSQQADCPAGTTCTAGKWKLFQIGFCM